ncbi:BN159_2729 family protein [Streptomyces sp. NPDC060002]|uniref:BN159_2729 family protein n=1 Tax=Streptomyces sp. NPDC060002 TaxID=3347033 RepID=UPI0036908022
MNGNVLHAARVIRTVLATVRTEQAAAVAHALDSARLLVDPERSFGVVLYRTPDGGWSRTARPVTELERQALTWDTSCERARHVARAIERHLDTHPGPHAVRVEGDRVRVSLRVDGLAQWARWRSYFGIAIVGERTEPHTLTGEGERDGVRVTVVALSASTAPPESATGEEKRRFRIGQTLYDLALPMRDVYGGVWYFEGRRSSDGMPLMALDGRPERCSLANVAVYLGPLSPVRPDDDGTVAGPAGSPSTVPARSAPTDPPAPPDRAVPHVLPIAAVPHLLPSAAVPRTLPNEPGAWAMVDVPEAGAPPDVPRPRVMPYLPDLPDLPDLRDLRDLRTISGLPEQARAQAQAQQPEPVEPAEQPHRPAWAEPFGPLVPSVPTAGPAGPVR